MGQLVACCGLFPLSMPEFPSSLIVDSTSLELLKVPWSWEKEKLTPNSQGIHCLGVPGESVSSLWVTGGCLGTVSSPILTKGSKKSR